MLEAGIDLKVTSQRLGHSSVAITADTYTHVLSKLDRAAAGSLDTLFRDSSATMAPGDGSLGI